MKKMTKILSLILSAMLLLPTAAACTEENGTVELPESLASYLDSGKEFRYYGYSCIRSGNFNAGSSSYYTGYSMVNEYYMNQFYDSGMVVLQAQSTAPANSLMEDPDYYNKSTLKYVLDTAHELGYDNSVLITDNRFYVPYNKALNYANTNKIIDHKQISLIKEEGNLDFEGQYRSEEELDKDVYKWLTLYSEHPAFTGVMLQDEPPAKMLRVIGQLYKSIRRVEKQLKADNKLLIDEIMINANLLPYYPNLIVAGTMPVVDESFSVVKQERDDESYRRYLEYFMEESNAKNLAIDIYPLVDTGVYRTYIYNLQVAAEVAKQHNAKINIVNQTTTYNNKRIMSMEDLTFLNNILMGFGAENIGYYTYFTADGNETYDFNDWGSLVSYFGDVTDLYYRVQKINESGQKFAPVVLNFDYQTSEVYMTSTEANPVTTHSAHVQWAQDYKRKDEFAKFTKLTSFELNKEMAVVTELYDKDEGYYMYMLMNVVDPLFTGANAYETLTATFTDEYTHAWVWRNGESRIEKLDKNHAITVKLAAGEADYVIPFKA